MTQVVIVKMRLKLRAATDPSIGLQALLICQLWTLMERMTHSHLLILFLLI